MSESAGDEIVVEHRGRVMVITLNRPAARNAMTPTMATAIGRSLDTAAASDAVGAIVVTGAGVAFCAGGDRRRTERGESIHSRQHPEWGFGGMRHHFVPKPVVAAVNGAALGGGFELCLAADIVIAATHAVFGLPEIALGVAPNAGGALRLMHHLPRKRALELILTGAPISAKTAHEWGLVNRVVASEELLDTAIEVATTIAGYEPSIVATTKRLAYGVGEPGGAVLDDATRWHLANRPPLTP